MRLCFCSFTDELDAYELDTACERLSTPEGQRALRPQAYAVLHMLLTRAPDLVTIRGCGQSWCCAATGGQ